MQKVTYTRLIVSWLTVLCFYIFGSAWLSNLGSPVILTGLFLWLFIVILWSAFGVVHEAEELAALLGEPHGTLILTLSIVIIEVALVAAVMLGAKAAPTLGRDTMFAVLMIILNGVVGLGLLIGGYKFREQSYNLQGSASYLSVLIPLTTVPLILPNFTTSTDGGTLTTLQSVAVALFTVVLYAIFLITQTGRHRAFYVHPDALEATKADHSDEDAVEIAKHTVFKHTILLLLNILPIVLLSKSLAKILDHGINYLELPAALGGVVVAAIVFTSEAISSLKAVARNDLQRAINLCLGSAASTVGLTVPAVLIIGLITGQPVVLGLKPTEMTLLAITLLLSTLTFSNKRTTLLEGAVHLTVFFVYITLVFSP
ncbi:MAG: calcium:proton antiporter [Bdellovibrio sp. ArHS]|uniref:calcium:proton antiporter n=1 Tax=Bdellovibrio sp. ArHS TaxID=1569284 RepID=UPI000583E9D4|nr:calcium:proton antiporter [Bdellovibrio sp. ArHS]KHD89373.1 MAG: calcium:proton antiporter [Bdellovibrio sp. ArHS]